MENTAKAWTIDIDIETFDAEYEIAMALDEIEIQLIDYNEDCLLGLSLNTISSMEANC